MTTQDKNSSYEYDRKIRISIEDVIHMPSPGMVLPNQIQFNPDGTLISFLYSDSGNLNQNLYIYNPETGGQTLLATPPDGGTQEGSLSPEEELQRERSRQRTLGITQYAWSKIGNHILIPIQGNIYIIDQPGDPMRKLVDAGGKPTLDPQFSPDGQWVSYVQDAEVYIIPVEGGEPRRVTHGARGTGKMNGLAEFIAQEEMGRRHGYWWSKDSRYIAFTEVDETHIPVYRIMHQGKDTTGPGSWEDHRYPFAGAENACVKLGVVAIEDNSLTWMNYDTQEYEYLARVEWLPDGTLSAQLENREQNELALVRFDPSSGKRTPILKENSKYWINLHDIFKPIKDVGAGQGGGFIWASERSGFRHLYLYDLRGKLIRTLTSGSWMVDTLVGVDEENGLVYFTGTREDPRESHMYVVRLDGSGLRRLTDHPGMHSIVTDHTCRRYVDTYSSLDKTPRVELRTFEDSLLLNTIHVSQDERVERLKLRPPELVTLNNRHGDTLYGAIFYPPSQYGERPYPTVISIYGGPHAQRVTNQWGVTADLHDQYLADRGFLVFRLDNRGSARRGLAFEGIIKNRIGYHEVEDQVDGVRYLVERGLTDPQRVGITGWSYGGYMSAMCLAQEPEIFKVAVAGAPTSNMDGYDTHYTERYMSTPQNNTEGYKLSSVQHYVANIQGHLLIIHGLIDENVHFRHTARLINALIDSRKPYDLLLLPDSRHGPRKPEYLYYLYQHLADYFERYL
jgi:dipeptidyl-peptidase-4